jgi:SAM-dependent methyltransferase
MQRSRGPSTTKFVPLKAELGRTADWNFAGKPPIRDVPYVPTPDHVVAKMLAVAEVNERDVVYDLGCGDGRIVIAAAKECGARGVGIDIDPVRIESCRLNAFNAGVGGRVRFEIKSVFRAEIAEASVVALYLLPWMNAQLRPKLLAELKPGTRIVAHQFAIAQWPPDKVARIEGQDRVVYLWIVPAKVNGRWSCSLRTRDGVLRRGMMTFEQEFQTVVATLELDGREYDVEEATLWGERLRFSIDGATYEAQVSGEMMRGAGHRTANREGRRRELELRARKM